jgi:hypothetical protein
MGGGVNNCISADYATSRPSLFPLNPSFDTHTQAATCLWRGAAFFMPGHPVSGCADTQENAAGTTVNFHTYPDKFPYVSKEISIRIQKKLHTGGNLPAHVRKFKPRRDATFCVSAINNKQI